MEGNRVPAGRGGNRARFTISETQSSAVRSMRRISRTRGADAGDAHATWHATRPVRRVRTVTSAGLVAQTSHHGIALDSQDSTHNRYGTTRNSPHLSTPHMGCPCAYSPPCALCRPGAWPSTSGRRSRPPTVANILQVHSGNTMEMAAIHIPYATLPISTHCHLCVKYRKITPRSARQAP